MGTRGFGGFGHRDLVEVKGTGQCRGLEFLWGNGCTAKGSASGTKNHIRFGPLGLEVVNSLGKVELGWAQSLVVVGIV